MSQHERQTLDFNDRDKLSIAGIIYYCATLGENVQIRNSEVTTRRIRPDLDDLINTVYGKIRNLPYQFYPNHVAFWTPSTKLQMICEASSRLYNSDSIQNIFLESKREDLHGGNIDWSAAINREKPGLWAAMTSKGEPMTPTSTSDLVRFIRMYTAAITKTSRYF
ncbi:hypothetical protein QL285_025510 [Trifolium repens]|nr:hypothetical protein QL285_025510 [Trifolium repens]